jgi:hypothetical protein
MGASTTKPKESGPDCNRSGHRWGVERKRLLLKRERMAA